MLLFIILNFYSNLTGQVKGPVTESPQRNTAVYMLFLQVFVLEIISIYINTNIFLCQYPPEKHTQIHGKIQGNYHLWKELFSLTSFVTLSTERAPVFPFLQ